ncbi:MAG TPA: OsmC family protein [Bacteroidales bacterium]|nr:OsmC family protein [Bacteroidales bacterium]
MAREHHFKAEIRWTGNKGSGTSSYEAYSRDHMIMGEGKQSILSSSAPAFRGDPALYNPEELLVASLSSCHMLWYLHLCAEAGVNVLEYTDKATGTMEVEKGGSGRFTEVILHPEVTVTSEEMKEKALELHHGAHEKCFIANSCNFPVNYQPVCRVKQSAVI